MDFGKFNLIYSKNETGKTYLVEFIIQCLFKNKKRWKFRNSNGRGKVTLQGLEEAPKEFSLSTTPKVDTLWEDTGIGLPPDFSSLLVAKGAESAISDEGVGIDKQLIKKLLSSKAMLDNIDNSISRTIQGAVIENQIVSGANRGDIKKYIDLKSEIAKIDHLIQEVEDTYSTATKTGLKQEKSRIEEEISLLEKSKKHKAYKLSEKINELKKEEKEYSKIDITDIETNISVLNSKITDLNQLKRKLSDSLNECKNYQWLEKAKEYYDSERKSEIENPDRKYLIASSISGVIGIILSLFDQSIIASAFYLLMVGIFIYYHLDYVKASKNKQDNEELSKIATEFKKRTNSELTDIAVLEEFIEKERKIFEASELMEDQTNSKDAEIETLTRELSSKVNAIFGEDVDEENWQAKINDFKSKEKSINDEIQANEIELASISVNESDYCSEEVEIEFDQQKYDDCIEELEKVNEKIDNEESALETIKSKVCLTTGDDPLIEWNELIDNLHEKRKDTLLEYQDITSEIIGKIATHNVIEKLREEEDSKIKDSLESAAVQKPLYEITQRYNKITFTEDDSMIISDEFSDFELSQLSTGALEQVMLALRIGFTSKLMGENKLFLILDDAFQHSDWDRRPNLVDNLVTLAQNDWQIIYFTMDNHIRDIFNEKGGVFGDDYKYHCIDEI